LSASARAAVTRALQQIGQGPLYDALVALIPNDVQQGGSNTSYRRQFTQADLVGGALTVTHNLNQEWVSVTVFNNMRKVVIPTEAESIDANVMKLEFAPTYPPIAGTWTVVIIA
jgi:hypothetical protein